MDLHTLPEIPPNIGRVSNREFLWLRRNSTVRMPSTPGSRAGCSTCKGKGTFRSWDPTGEHVVTYRCDCDSQYLASLELTKRGIDQMYQRMDWYDLKMVSPENIQKVLDYLDNAERYIESGRGLIFAGDPGTGKTTLMYLLAKALILKGVDVYVTQHNHMLDLYKSGWSSDEDKEIFRSRVYRSKWLVIDDFGTERDQRGGRGVDETLLDQVLRSRASSNAPTSATTNVHPDALNNESRMHSKYDDRIKSLLQGTTDTLVFRGTDYRPVAKQNRDEEIRMGISRPVVMGVC